MYVSYWSMLTLVSATYVSNRLFQAKVIWTISCILKFIRRTELICACACITHTHINKTPLYYDTKEKRNVYIGIWFLAIWTNGYDAVTVSVFFESSTSSNSILFWWRSIDPIDSELMTSEGLFWFVLKRLNIFSHVRFMGASASVVSRKLKLRFVCGSSLQWPRYLDSNVVDRSRGYSVTCRRRSVSHRSNIRSATDDGTIVGRSFTGGSAITLAGDDIEIVMSFN